MKVPSGPEGEAYLREKTRLMWEFADKGDQERFAMKALAVLPRLVLQRPSRKSSTLADAKHLKKSLALWAEGNLETLLIQGRRIQNNLPERTGSLSTEHITKIFNRLMMEGKISSALRFLGNQSSGGVLSLDDLVRTKDGTKTVLDVLEEKHPTGKPLPQGEAGVFVGDPHLPSSEELRDFYTCELSVKMVREAFTTTTGAAGVSGLDAAQWTRFVTAYDASDELCAAAKACAVRLASEDVDPEALEGYVANRAIPLDKQPGVRPIGVGEVFRRALGKAISWVNRNEIRRAAGALQTCAGLEGGCEAACHAIQSAFTEDSVEGVLLIDAENAFNALNRRAALHNIQFRAPRLARYLINTYRVAARLFVGGKELSSSEGTTQGDPLGSAMYAIAVVPLIELLSDNQHKGLGYPFARAPPPRQNRRHLANRPTRVKLTPLTSR
jgi:hypothetical protein